MSSDVNDSKIQKSFFPKDRVFKRKRSLHQKGKT